jgi:hypothetical protein
MTILFIVASCATSPDKIMSNYVSPLKYRDYTCDEISMVQQDVERKVGRLKNKLQNDATADRNQAIVGTLLFWPAYFWLEGGDSAEAGEYAQLKGEYDALEDAAVAKKCMLAFRS